MFSESHIRQFLDIEAVVDDREDAEMSEDGEQELDQFLDDGEDLEEESFRGSSPPDFRTLDHSKDQADTTRILESLRQHSVLRETPFVPKAILYSVPVKPTTEEHTVKVLEGVITSLRRKQHFCSIQSVKYFAKFPKQVFVWANGSVQLQNIVSLYSWILHREIIEVDQTDWLRLYSPVDDSFEYPFPSWARIKAGLYRQDLVLVERSYSNGFIDVLVVPRLYKRNGRKRPDPSLLQESKAIEIHGAKAVQKSDTDPNWFHVRKSLIKYGLHCIYIEQAKVRNALPHSLSELTLFVEASTSVGFPTNSQSFIFDTASDIKTADALTIFEAGDRVTIATGSLLGTHGKIHEIVNDSVATVTVQSVQSQSAHTESPLLYSVALRDLRRVFKVGDYIRVRCGLESGRSGIVTEVDGPAITFSDKKLHSTEKIDIAEVTVYACDIDFYEPDKQWHQYHASGARDSDDLAEIPAMLHQRVEIIDGPLRGSRGYVEGWSKEGITVHLYFTSSYQQPSHPLQTHDYIPTGDKVCIPSKYLARCFIPGDIVFKKGLRNSRFIVQRGPGVDPDSPSLIFPSHILVLRASYDRKTAMWASDISSEEAFCLVHRSELIMEEVAHNPVPNWKLRRNPIKKNWVVKIIKGPRKGYRGRVRNIHRDDVDIEVEAIQKVERFPWNFVMRDLQGKLVPSVPPPEPTIRTAIGNLTPAQPEADAPATTTSGYQTPLPPLVLEPGQSLLPPAWDPYSRTPGDPSVFDYSTHSAEWLLSPLFRHALDTVIMMFSIRNSSDFMDGKYEGFTCRTTPLDERDGSTAGPNEVLAHVGVTRISMISIPVRFLRPQPGSPDSQVVIIGGSYAGLITTAGKQTVMNDLAVSIPGSQQSMHLPPSHLVQIFQQYRRKK